MDAIEFIKQLRRMDEKGVPKNRFIYLRVGRETDSPEDVVAEVEEWVKMNPVKTRQIVFLEQWPETEVDKSGCLRLCPELVSADYRNRHADCPNRVCMDCRREFWMKEVE